MITTEKKIWGGCYDGNWNGFITPSSFAHPAKYARGLIERIYDYLVYTMGLKDGDVVVDPFGGIGTGGIIGAYHGVQWIGCELEPKFVKLSKANFKMHKAKWKRLGVPMPKIVRGDSRKLRKSIKKAMADCVISSPPWVEIETPRYIEGTFSSDPNRLQEHTANRQEVNRQYGTTSGQLGNLPSGSVDAVISSPPYADQTDKRGEIDWTKTRHGSRESAYGNGKCSDADGSDGYGSSPGQLGNLPSGSVDAVVSSPPYEGTQVISSGVQRNEKGWGAGGDLSDGKSKHYGETNGQLGESIGDTFWHAAREIVAECFQILKMGGVAVWVCKDFVRKGKRVPFSDDWQRLCEACGFVLVERIQASLVKEDRHPSLFGGDDVKTTERKSFFRRLAENKGSPRIDHEDVIVMVKPTGGSGGAASVCSPPFVESLADKPSSGIRKQLGSTMGRAVLGDDGYGTTAGQLGSMKPGSVDAVISSPPYAGIRQDGGGIANEGEGGFGAYTDEPANTWHTQRDQNNLGNMRPGSVEDVC